jgi:hypothetical protein
MSWYFLPGSGSGELCPCGVFGSTASNFGNCLWGDSYVFPIDLGLFRPIHHLQLLSTLDQITQSLSQVFDIGCLVAITPANISVGNFINHLGRGRGMVLMRASGIF